MVQFWLEDRKGSKLLLNYLILCNKGAIIIIIVIIIVSMYINKLNWIYLVVVVVVVITFIQGIYNYMRETIFLGYIIFQLFCCYNSIHVLLFPMLNLLYFYISTFWSIIIIIVVVHILNNCLFLDCKEVR